MKYANDMDRLYHICVSGRISQMKTKLKWKHVRLTHNITVYNSMNKLEQNVLKT